MKTLYLFFIIIFYNLAITSEIHAQVFGGRMDLGLIQYNSINEASGIAASRKNTNVLWTHNDSGDSNRIFALNNQGNHLGVYKINSATNRDWEDIAVGPGPISGSQYIYIGDIGDNDAVYNLKYIYRVLEPNVNSLQNPKDTTLLNIDKITFQYPDGNRDAETIMIDPLTKDIYIVSKREDSVRVYLLTYPQSTSQTITATRVATLGLKGGQSTPQSYTVGGDIAHNGLEIIIKTRGKIYYWHRTPGQNLWEAFSAVPIILPYTEEPQGEGVTWALDARGYFTISEEAGGVPAHLYFYPRTDEPLSYQFITLDEMIEGFYNGSSMVSDTAIAQLRSFSSPQILVDETKILLDNTGHGTGKFTNGEPGINYYLIISHRNSIETWSANSVQFSLASLNYNFTSAQNNAYGNNLKLIGTKWCVFSGDVNQDGSVDSVDLGLIYNDVYTNSFNLLTDITGDHFVDLNDLILCDNNFFNIVKKVTPILNKRFIWGKSE